MVSSLTVRRLVSPQLSDDAGLRLSSVHQCLIVVFGWAHHGKIVFLSLCMCVFVQYSTKFSF